MKNVLSLYRRLSQRVAMVALVILLASLAGVLVAYAQTDVIPEVLPTDFTDLLAPAGLGVVVTCILGLLKRLNSKSHGKFFGGFGDWLNKTPLNQFAISLVLSGIVVGLVQLVLYFGVGEIAQNVWTYFGIAWVVSQGFYNTQKVAAKTVAGS